MRLFWTLVILSVFAFTEALSKGQLQRRHNNAKSNAKFAYQEFINATRNDASKVELEISTQSGDRNDTAPLLYGLFFEDISVCIYDNIYSMLNTKRRLAFN